MMIVGKYAQPQGSYVGFQLIAVINASWVSLVAESVADT